MQVCIYVVYISLEQGFPIIIRSDLRVNRGYNIDEKL